MDREHIKKERDARMARQAKRRLFADDATLGTRRVAAGEGATLEELHSAICGPVRWTRRTTDAEHAALKHVASLWAPVEGIHWNARTNLALTGRPLTTTDLERIARCEVVK